MAAPVRKKIKALMLLQNNLQIQIDAHKRIVEEQRRKVNDLSLLSAMIVASSLDHKTRKPRSAKALYRTEQWWLDMEKNLDVSEDEEQDNVREKMWKENFCVNRETFHYICDQLQCQLLGQDTNMGKCIPLLYSWIFIWSIEIISV